jgi:hypothetical protein
LISNCCVALRDLAGSFSRADLGDVLYLLHLVPR